jgi:hypothetical protein
LELAAEEDVEENGGGHDEEAVEGEEDLGEVEEVDVVAEELGGVGDEDAVLLGGVAAAGDDVGVADGGSDVALAIEQEPGEIGEEVEGHPAGEGAVRAGADLSGDAG